MNKLEEKIRTLLIDTGPITFERFMKKALYDEEHGYYTSGNVSIGKSGDFYTSPYVHYAFGEIIATFIEKSLQHINTSAPRVIEMGSGRGTLAKDILDKFKRDMPSVYDKLIYTLIEKSAHLTNEAREVLENHLDKLRFVGDITELESLSFEGVIISNELFDALPFHRVTNDGGEIREIYVSFDGENFIETVGELSTKELNKYMNINDLQLVEGQEIEINLSAAALLNDISDALRKGIILTIDYGYLAQELYTSSRMKGTYKCMKEHKISEDPYVDIGKQDITSHVDFSNLIREGEKRDLNELKYTTQGQFLVDWGILELIEELSKSGNESLEKNIGSIKNLFLPGSMGNQFKVLIQEKGLGDTIAYFYPEQNLKISFEIT